MLAKLRSGVNDHQGLPVSTLKFYFPGHILTDQSEMYPSEIFVDLESGLASHKAKGPAGKNEASTGTKRTYDQSTSGPSSAPESKQSRVSVFENGGSVLGPTPSTPAASTSTRSDLDMPSLSTLSKNQCAPQETRLLDSRQFLYCYLSYDRRAISRTRRSAETRPYPPSRLERVEWHASSGI
jgi:hypothetical protein